MTQSLEIGYHTLDASPARAAILAAPNFFQQPSSVEHFGAHAHMCPFLTGDKPTGTYALSDELIIQAAQKHFHIERDEQGRVIVLEPDKPQLGLIWQTILHMPRGHILRDLDDRIGHSMALLTRPKPDYQEFCRINKGLTIPEFLPDDPQLAAVGLRILEENATRKSGLVIRDIDRRVLSSACSDAVMHVMYTRQFITPTFIPVD